MKIEEHLDDCGEDLSSLKGVELCSLAWTSSLDEEAEPITSETAHAHACGGVMFFYVVWTLHYTGYAASEHGCSAEHYCLE